jgi:diamine N-acetyltransferase
MNAVKEITIRPCSQADVDTLVWLGIKTFRETFDAVNTAENMNLYLQTTFHTTKILDEMKERGSCFFLAEEDGQPVGFAKVRDSKTPPNLNGSRAIEIERIYAVKEKLGKGIGQKLMEKCLEHARRNNYEIVWLGVWEHNDKAISFYKKWGFEKFGQHAFMLGHDEQTDFLMKKKLM